MSMFSPLKSAYSRSRPPAASQQQTPPAAADDLEELDRSMSRIESIVRKHGLARMEREQREREERDRRRKRTSVPPSEAFSGVTNGRRVRRGSSIVKEEGGAAATEATDPTNDTTTASHGRTASAASATTADGTPRASVGSIDEDVVTTTAADTFGDSTMAAAAAVFSEDFDGGEGDVGGDDVAPPDPKQGRRGRPRRRGDAERRARRRTRRRHVCGATFVDFDDDDEEEVVELLRRVAELVVRGEQRASLIERAGAAVPPPPIPSSSKEGNDHDDNDNDDETREGGKEGDADAGAAAVAAAEREREKEAHSALFNRFLERQGLALVVNIVSGKAFSSSPNTGTKIKKSPAGATKKIDPLVESSQQRGDISDGANTDDIIGDSCDAHKEDHVQEGASDPDQSEGDGATSTVKNPQSGDETEAAADVDRAEHKDSHQEGGNNNGNHEEPPEDEEPEDKEELCTCVYLPPIVVATQAVQSMSILFQNVCLATSLYLLLSNNLVNDLINLPLELYGEAASSADENAEEGGNSQTDESDYSDDESSNDEGEQDDDKHADGGKQQQMAEEDFKSFEGEEREGGDGDGFNEELRRQRRRTRLASQPRRRRRPWDSAEMSELATHFVSFLKSLAMRINPETLQFYLKHPARPFSRDNGEVVDVADGHDGEGGDGVASAAVTDEVETLLREVGEVDFPLYERALEFCSVDQDSFVRVTAMNICLNMLRLATVGAAAMGEDSAEFPPSPSSPSLSGGHSASNSSSLHDLLSRADGAAPPPPLPLSSPPSSPSTRARAKSTESASSSDLARKGSAAFRHVLKSPDANLVSVVLPLRDRLAVANHVCRPERVQRFVGPIFFRLLHLCGTLGELMQELDEVEAAEARQQRRRRTGDCDDDDGDDLEDNEDSTGGLEESLVAQQKLLESVQSTAADMQDELLLLDDVFKLGLTALNEQIIEMMLATFIYPMLLQPLLLCARPGPVGGVGTGVVGRTSSNVSAASSVASANDDVEEAESSSSPPSRSETVSMLLSSQPNHPFTMDSVSRSLQESGLLTSGGATVAGGGSGGKRAGATTDRLPSFGHKTTAAAAPATATGNTSPSPAPAKTALFGLFSVFGTITNRPLLQLLFTAMFHPLAPDGSRGELFVAKPSVLGVGKDGKAQIAIDSSQPCSSSLRAHSSAATYAFGRISPDAVEVIQPHSRAGEGVEGSERSGINVDEDDQCCFVLSPALASVFENDPSVQKKPNTYRQIVLTCLAGSGERGQTNDLQHVAVLAFGAALSALKDGGVGDVLFGTVSSLAGGQDIVAGERKEEARNGEGKDAPLFVQDQSSDDCLRDVTQRHGKRTVNKDVGPSGQATSGTLDHILELVAALCVSVMSSTVCINGVWRLDYNFTAAHALLNVVASNSFAKEKAVKLVEHRRRQSASFLIQLPSLVDTAFVEKLAQKDKDDGLPKAIIEDTDEHQLDLILDRIFHDHIDGDESCILNALQREWTGKGEDDKQYFMTQIAKKCSLVEACDQLYGENAFHSTVLVSDSKNAALSCAAASALAHMRLDALATFLRDGPSLTAGFHSSSEEISSQVFVSRSYDVLPGGIHAGRYEEEDDEVTVAAISPNMYSFLCTEQESEETSSAHHTYPKPGAVVRLVGRVAFPCVCEVTESSATLFTDGRACVIADGVRWQSLYLVFIGRYMLLAEPVKTGSGGNGRIVTSCHLSCMSVSKDKPQTSSASSTARRLVLRHESPDLNPPGAFVLDRENSSMMVGCGVLVRSRMDLWFEDSGAVCTAFDTFNAKILKARAKRGKRLREALSRVASS